MKDQVRSFVRSFVRSSLRSSVVPLYVGAKWGRVLAGGSLRSVVCSRTFSLLLTSFA